MSPVTRVVPVLATTSPEHDAAAWAAVLGLEVVMDHGWIRTLATPDHRHQVSLLSEDLTAASRPVVSVGVADVEAVDAAHARAVAQGLVVVHPLQGEAWGVHRFSWRDPSGHVVNVVAHRS